MLPGDGLGLSPTSSRANVGLSQISLPLAWKPKETRTFSMFLVIQSKTRVIDTKIISHVDKNMTDVIIPDSFVFDNEPEDFNVDILIYAARTDYGLENNTGGSLKSRITRSIGRKFGSSVKSQVSTPEMLKSPRLDQTISGAHYNLLAKATLSIADACEEATIHNLRMSAFADLSGPPLYGHIICRLAIQPHSVLRPILEGVLSVQHVEEGVELENTAARLQAGNLHFYSIGDIANSSKNTVLIIPLSSRSRIVPTPSARTFLLRTDESKEVPASSVYIVTNSDRDYEIWRRAIEIQIYDIGIWGRFATKISSLLTQKREDPIRETLSRGTGSNLYETISIKGSISKAFGGLSLVPCDGQPHPNGAATAPVKRPQVKQRAKVIDFFQAQSPKPSRKSIIHEPSSNYVIQLNIGEDVMENEYNSYSPLYRMSPRPPSSYRHHSDDQYKDGKKSWSKSIGSLINRNASHVTRL
ncbi:PH domain-containing protein [Caenorhabditis elegans]|nr:PH domain-containing protein [Caenorhabditis elegans]CAG8860261.1 PH domain-containing protein [Caenorhabditis elegans]